MNKQCSTHATEHVHVFTFHFFCLSCENLRFENGRKLRSGFGIVKILSHFWELGWVFYIFGIVIQCLTCFVLKVCAKAQRIRMFESLLQARVFGWRLKKVSHGLGQLLFYFSHHTIASAPPEPIWFIFNDFWLFLFLIDSFIFSHVIKNIKIFFLTIF